MDVGGDGLHASRPGHALPAIEMEELDALVHGQPADRGADGAGSADKEDFHAGTFLTVSPVRMVPGWTTLALMPRRWSSLPTGELTKIIASRPKRATNLLQPVWGTGVTSNDRVADGQAGAGRHIFLAQVQVDIELVPRQGPAFLFLGDQGGRHARS